LQAELTHHLQLQELELTQNWLRVKQQPQRLLGKTVQGDLGQIPLQVPRDRQSTFEPVLVPKGQRRLAGWKVIGSLYARGASTRDIQAHLQDLYGVRDFSHTIAKSQTSSLKRQWQSRPRCTHPIVWLMLLVKVKRATGLATKPSTWPWGQPRRQQGTPRLWLFRAKAKSG